MQDPSWYRALTFAERRRYLANVPPEARRADPELAERRLARWRERTPFEDDELWRARLASEELTIDDFREVLGAAPPANGQAWPGQVPHPIWSAVAADLDADRPSLEVPEPELEDAPQLGRFLVAVEPFLAPKLEEAVAAAARIAEGVGTPPFDPGDAQRLLLTHLLERTLGLASRTLVLELHVARLEGRLAGETPQARFASFCELLRDPESLAGLYREYPVLARQLRQRICNWLDFGVEFLGHLAEDWPHLTRAFPDAAGAGHLKALDGGVGDRHRGGRAVLVASFASGFRVVYKPRSMRVDRRFQDLLAWLNERGQEPAFRTLTVADRGDHGWMEFVVAHSCDRREEVHRFYRRQGAYLALLYMLEASDFHYENLIAAGEHPVMIDLESLFHPRAGGMDIHRSELAAAHSMAQSVMRVGLLPTWLWANREHGGIDLSGLGAREGQLSPHTLPGWRDAGTDRIRLARDRLPMPAGSHRPRLDGEGAEAVDYEADLVDGFTSTYRRLAAHRGALLEADGPLAAFADCEVRVVLRPTQSYGLVLQESFHPDLLRDALDRERHFDLLWVPMRHRPYLAAVVAAEKQDLWRGDIPLFTTRPRSRDLFTSTGERVADFFDDTGLELVRRRLETFSEGDLERQVWFLRSSLAASTVDLETAAWPSYELGEARAPASRERLLTAARRVGDRLEELALRGGDEATWIGLTSHQGRNWALVPLKVDLYSGSTGVLFFLAHLAAVTGEERYERLARAALAGVRRTVARDGAVVNGLGGFSGWGGLIYALTHLAALWDEPELLDEAEAMARRLPARVTEDDGCDLLGGAAGAILGLAVLERARPGHALAAARACGEHLLARAQPMAEGWGWRPDVEVHEPLAGFAHGAAGVALALLELAALSGDGRYRDAALAAIAYERTLFDPAANNWRDVRNLEIQRMSVEIGDAHFLSAWCHGAPGVGLARLAGRVHLDGDEIRREIEAALANTLERGFGENHCLCHGDLGNLELLLQASRELDRERWQPHVDRLAAAILDSIDDHGWLCGVPLGVETPGLMTGLAGVGYGLLRLAEPARVPSVLTLAPP